MADHDQRWAVLDAPPAGGIQKPLAGRFGPLPARLLANRGLTSLAAAEKYLAPSYSDLSDPFDLPGMPEAAERVARAIEAGEQIGVIGDFDVDGLTATALLLTAFRSFGADVVAYVPDRENDGHGVPRHAVSSMHAGGVGLVITADTGSSEIEALGYAAGLGMDVIVTDHHLLGAELPQAIAVVNPHLAGKKSPAAGLTGAGVAFKLAQAAGRRVGRAGGQPVARVAISLAALGTIADVGPLIDDNRIIAAEGLKALTHTDHAGLKSLLRRSKAGGSNGPVDAETVSFQIAPRLNAPGRLGHARVSLDLLVCDDPSRAEELAVQIDALNNERRRLGREADTIADAQIGKLPEVPALISVSSPRVQPGLLGPLAGRLAERFHRPALAGAIEGDTVRASLRSPPGFDIFAALEASAALFDRHGGHARAAGFTAPAASLPAIIAALEQAAAAAAGLDEPPGLQIDAEVGFDELGDTLWRFVERMAPFGEGNPAPLFLTRRVMPEQVSAVGKSGDHLRMMLDGGARSFRAVGFGLGRANLGSGLVDAAYVLRNNYWAGRKRPELELKGIRPSA